MLEFFLNLICKFKTIPIKVSAGFFLDVVLTKIIQYLYG